MRNSWQEDGICTGGGNNSGRRHCQLLARRFRATLQAWATGGWEIGWETARVRNKTRATKRCFFQVLIKVQKKQFSWSFRCYCEIPLEKDGKRRHVHVKKKVPYLEFGGWHGYGSTGSRRPDASNPVVYHGEIIIFPMYRWRLWVMPKLPGAILYSRPHCIPTMVGSMSPTDAPNLQCSLLKIFGFDAQINVLAGWITISDG